MHLLIMTILIIFISYNFTLSQINNTTNTSNSSSTLTQKDCFSINDCFTCTFNSKCRWTKGKCNDDIENTINVFDRSLICLLNSSFSVDLYNSYCGNGKLSIPSINLPIKVNNSYMKRNLYCKYKLINQNNLLIFNMTIKKDYNTLNLYEDLMEITYFNGEKKNFTIQHDSLYTTLYKEVSMIIYHYYSYNETMKLPYEILISESLLDKDSTYKLLIILLILVFVFFISIVLIWKLCKWKSDPLPRPTQRIESNRNSNINQSVVRDRMRKITNVALKSLFENEIKPRKYTNSLNQFKTECTICKEDFLLSDVVVNLLCNHIFHLECIKNWISKKGEDYKCPNCNKNIVPFEKLNDEILEITDNNSYISRNIMNRRSNTNLSHSYSRRSVINNYIIHDRRGDDYNSNININNRVSNNIPNNVYTFNNIHN